MVLPGHAASWAISLCLQGPLIRHSSGQSHRPCQLPLASPTIPIPCPLYPFTPPDWCSLPHFFFSSNLKLHVIPTTEPRPLLYLCISQSSPGKQKQYIKKYLIRIGPHGYGGWEVQTQENWWYSSSASPSLKEGETDSSAPRQQGRVREFSHSAFLFYAGLQHGGGPPTLGRAICTPSINSSVSLIQKQPHIHTKK